jgi:head-tail adaptor
MPGLSAGLLDRQMTLQTAATTQSESGEVTYAWDQATSVTVWAQWFPKGTREAFRFQREGAYIDGIVRIYDRSPRPTPENSRIVFDGRVFDVQGVTELGRGEGLDLVVVAHGEAP